MKKHRKKKKGSDDIDGKMFILHKAVWLKGLNERWTNGFQQRRPNVQWWQGSKEINRQRRQSRAVLHRREVMMPKQILD